MGLISVLQEEQISIAVDDEQQNIILELSSSGYRPRFVTMHINKREEVEQIIKALEKALHYLRDNVL